VIDIPETLSFTDACSFIPPIVTAYHAIVEAGSVMYSESVLVHEGASPVGQTAIRLLAGRGVMDVWTTAPGEAENIWITENLQLPKERILPKVWFESRSILRFQRKQKFDVVVARTDNSLSLLLDYVKSGGRYIVIKSRVTSSEELQTIQFAPESISVVTIHIESPDAYPLATPESLHTQLRSSYPYLGRV
jgi:NADPH:quinone reductase-like Zn-dependent oxidoreductase